MFVAGAPKSGTTSMHAYLAQHPAISMSAVKEPKFYLSDGTRPRYRGPGDMVATADSVWDAAGYADLFTATDGTRWFGDASPYYLWSEPAQARIAVQQPRARFLLMLRDPVDRAMANWSALRNSGREPLDDLRQAIAAEGVRRRAGWEPFWFYRDLGLYGAQLTALLSRFPAEQVKVLFFDDFAADPRAVLQGVLSWLGLEDDATIDVSPRGRTMAVPRTRRNRRMQALMARPPGLRHLVPRAARRRAAAWMNSSLAASAVPDAERGAAPDIRELFRDDLRTLDALVGGVPQGWLPAV